MPYTLAQLEFLGVHFGVAIPPDFLEKKRLAEESAKESAESEGEDTAPSSTDPLQAVLERRLTALEPRVLDAQKNRGGEVQWMTFFMTAQEHAEKGKIAEANKVLERLEKMLDAPAGPAQTDAAREAAPPAPKIAYAQARLGWDGARKRAQTDVANLEKAFLEMFKADPNFADLQTKIRKLDTILGKFDESLGDTLDKALNAADEEKPKFNQQALAIVGKYRAYVDGDPFIKAVVTNPLVKMNFQADLSSTLAQMAQQLAAA